VLDGVEVTSLLDRGFRGMAKAREHWHAPVGDRRTIDRLTQQQRAYNRLQARLRALVEQSIGHLANAWALRRWRGLLYRVQDVFRAAGALICLGRWLHRVPTSRSITDTLNETGCWRASQPIWTAAGSARNGQELWMRRAWSRGVPSGTGVVGVARSLLLPAVRLRGGR
jgi:hypothetical protein